MVGPVPPALPGATRRKPLTGFMWIGGYYIPRHDVSTEKANAVALRIDARGAGIMMGVLFIVQVSKIDCRVRCVYRLSM